MSRCTCTKDSEITCIVHPHDYEKVRILAAENAKLKETVDALLNSVKERGGSLSVVGSEELLRLATTRKAALEDK